MLEFADHGPVITPYSPESDLFVMGSTGITMGNAAWPAADRAFFWPFTILKPTRVYQSAIRNNTGTGNVDMGIYALDGTRLVSTGAVNLAASNVIYAGTTDILLAPGTYYAAISKDGIGGNNQRLTGSTNQRLQIRGVYQMASAYPLPATATFATLADNYMPLFSISTVSGLF